MLRLQPLQLPDQHVVLDIGDLGGVLAVVPVVVVTDLGPQCLDPHDRVLRGSLR